MEGRCAVEILTDFGFCLASSILKVSSSPGTDVFLTTGSDEVFVFGEQDRHIKAILIFPDNVRDLVVNKDKKTLYVACCTGVYCIRFSSLPSRAQSSESSRIPPRVKASHEHLVIREEGTLALLLLHSLLLNLRRENTSWLLTRYKIPEDSTTVARYETLGSFKAPLISDSDHRGSDERSEKKPVLFCVRPADASSKSPGAHASLDPVLFKVLFGIDAALAKSPVVLCGLPDGRLCFFAHRVPGSRLRVLYSLEQPVVFIGVQTNASHSLVALGESGKVVLVTLEPKATPGDGVAARFSEVRVPGPALCACLDKRSLYYSTGSDLLVLDLALVSSTGGSEAEKETLASPKTTADASRNVNSLNVCRVVALAEHLKNVEGQLQLQLLALSSRGQLQIIRPPVGVPDGGSSSHAGRAIKDVLSAIGDVCERASVLKSSVKSRNQTLTHLNQLLNISFLLKANANGKMEKPIRCRAVADWSTLLREDSLTLKYILDNGSPYILERGWTLNVTVSSMCDSAQVESSSAHYSFPFHNLHPGEKLEISLPLDTQGQWSLPCVVTATLAFALSSILGEKASAELSGGHLVNLPLNTLTVDCLHALRMVNPADVKRNAAPRSYDVTPLDTVRTFLKPHSGLRDDASSQKHSTCVKVSSQLLKETLKASEGTSTNVGVLLLDWLIGGEHGGVKSKSDTKTLDRSVVHARAPNGHLVKMTAKEVVLVNPTEEDSVVTPEAPLDIVEVRVESSSLAAVCGMHHAVLQRLQALLQKAPERSSTLNMQSLHVREALQHAKKILHKLQECRVSCNFGEGTSTGKMISHLLSAYEELRETSLLII
ncbi:Fanconi anemia core complex-associated protein 100 [Stigmatopora argus]